MSSLMTTIWRVLSLPKKLQLSIMRISQDQFLIGVTGIIFNDKDEVLLCKHSYRKTEWSLPGGYMKAKEHPSETVEREIKEETGLTVSADYEMRVRTDRETARLDMCFIGTYIGGEFTPSEEVTQIGFFSFDTLPLISRSQLLFIKQALEEKHLLEQKKLLKNQKIPINKTQDNKSPSLLQTIRRWFS
jgi:8-oxo-dGTP diphosphatase